MVARDAASNYMLKPTKQQYSAALHNADAENAKLNQKLAQLEGLEIENDDFVSSHTIEPGIRPEAQTPRLLKPRTVFWYKHPLETPVDVVIFADRRHRICCAEWMLAAYDDIATWRDRKIKRTELGVS